MSNHLIFGIPFCLLIYLTSNQSWHGIVDDYWPLNDPSVFEVAKGKASLVYLAQTENDYKTGNADVNKCLTKAIEATNCTRNLIKHEIP